MISAILLLMMGCTPADICEELREIRNYKEQRQPTCELVVEAAREFNIDPALLVSVLKGMRALLAPDALARPPRVPPLCRIERCGVARAAKCID